MKIDIRDYLFISMETESMPFKNALLLYPEALLDRLRSVDSFFEYHTILDKATKEALKIAEQRYEKESIYWSEFSKVKHIDLLLFYNTPELVNIQYRYKRFQDGDEKALLTEILKVVDGKRKLVGFNILNHTIPFIFQRMLANDMAVNSSFNLQVKKTWEVDALDIMHLVKGYQYAKFMSLNSTLALFGLRNSGKGEDDLLNIARVFRNIKRNA